MDNFLESYLVKLGFSVDEPSATKFRDTMSMAESQVTAHTSGMAKRVLEAQEAIVGAFVSISSAIIGTVDKAAMADQGYRLLGLRMMMTTESARKMDIITKALGASMGEIIWDPELHQRAQELSGDMDNMTKSLGLGFESGMRGVRDLRFEFTRLGVGVQFLGMQFAKDLWEQLNPGEKGKSLHEWVTDLERRIPEFSKKLVSYAVPALKTTWEIVKQLGEVLKETGVLFSNVVGVLSGDKSIEGAAFSFDKIAKAIQHVGDWMAKLAGSIGSAEGLLAHFAVGTSLLFEKDWEAAGKEFKAGIAEFSKTAASAKDSGQGANAQSGAVQPSQLPGESPTAPKNSVSSDSSNHPSMGIISSLWDKSVIALAGTGGFTKSNAETRDQAKSDASFLGGIATSDWMGHLIDFVQALTAWTPSMVGEKPPEKSTDATPKSKTDSHSSVNPTVASDLISRIAAVITKVEAGDKPNPISVQNNNPGNLRSWGHFPVVNGYVKFPDKATGDDALKHQIEKNIGLGLTLEEFFAGSKVKKYPGFSPETNKNDPEAYAARVARELDIEINVPLNKLQPTSEKPAEYKTYGPWPTQPPAAPVSPKLAAPAQQNPPMGPPQAYVQPMPSVNQPIWMQPHADDTAPRATLAAYHEPAYISGPESASMADRDWTAALANMQRSITPQSNVSHTQQSLVVDVGGIYITEPGASAQQIQRAVAKAIQDAQTDQIFGDLAQLSAAY